MAHSHTHYHQPPSLYQSGLSLHPPVPSSSSATIRTPSGAATLTSAVGPGAGLRHATASPGQSQVQMPAQTGYSHARVMDAGEWLSTRLPPHPSSASSSTVGNPAPVSTGLHLGTHPASVVGRLTTRARTGSSPFLASTAPPPPPPPSLTAGHGHHRDRERHGRARAGSQSLGSPFNSPPRSGVQPGARYPTRNASLSSVTAATPSTFLPVHPFRSAAVGSPTNSPPTRHVGHPVSAANLTTPPGRNLQHVSGLGPPKRKNLNLHFGPEMSFDAHPTGLAIGRPPLPNIATGPPLSLAKQAPPKPPKPPRLVSPTTTKTTTLTAPDLGLGAGLPVPPSATLFPAPGFGSLEPPHMLFDAFTPPPFEPTFSSESDIKLEPSEIEQVMVIGDAATATTGSFLSTPAHSPGTMVERGRVLRSGSADDTLRARPASPDPKPERETKAVDREAGVDAPAGLTVNRLSLRLDVGPSASALGMGGPSDWEYFDPGVIGPQTPTTTKTEAMMVTPTPAGVGLGLRGMTPPSEVLTAVSNVLSATTSVPSNAATDGSARIEEAERSRDEAQKHREQAEKSWKEAEKEREEAERQRAEAEQRRVDAEQRRAEAEQRRAEAEDGRISAESARDGLAKERDEMRARLYQLEKQVMDKESVISALVSQLAAATARAAQDDVIPKVAFSSVLTVAALCQEATGITVVKGVVEKPKAAAPVPVSAFPMLGTLGTTAGPVQPRFRYDNWVPAALRLGGKKTPSAGTSAADRSRQMAYRRHSAFAVLSVGSALSLLEPPYEEAEDSIQAEEQVEAEAAEEDEGGVEIVDTKTATPGTDLSDIAELSEPSEVTIHPIRTTDFGDVDEASAVWTGEATPQVLRRVDISAISPQPAGLNARVSVDGVVNQAGRLDKSTQIATIARAISLSASSPSAIAAASEVESLVQAAARVSVDFEFVDRLASGWRRTPSPSESVHSVQSGPGGDAKPGHSASYLARVFDPTFRELQSRIAALVQILAGVERIVQRTTAAARGGKRSSSAASGLTDRVKPRPDDGDESKSGVSPTMTVALVPALKLTLDVVISIERCHDQIDKCVQARDDHYRAAVARRIHSSSSVGTPTSASSTSGSILIAAASGMVGSSSAPASVVGVPASSTGPPMPSGQSPSSSSVGELTAAKSALHRLRYAYAIVVDAGVSPALEAVSTELTAVGRAVSAAVHASESGPTLAGGCDRESNPTVSFSSGHAHDGVETVRARTQTLHVFANGLLVALERAERMLNEGEFRFAVASKSSSSASSSSGSRDGSRDGDTAEMDLVKSREEERIEKDLGDIRSLIGADVKVVDRLLDRLVGKSKRKEGHEGGSPRLELDLGGGLGWVW